MFEPRFFNPATSLSTLHNNYRSDLKILPLLRENYFIGKKLEFEVTQKQTRWLRDSKSREKKRQVK